MSEWCPLEDELWLRDRVVRELGLLDLWSVRGVSRAHRLSAGEALRALGALVLCGGRDDHGGRVREVRALELDTRQWRGLPALGRGRSYGACVAQGGGTLLCIGGFAQGLYTACVEALGAGAAAWEDRPNLSSGGRSSFAAVACADGSVLLLGGIREGAVTASVERLDPATGVCTQLPPLLGPRYGFAWGVLGDGRVVIAGGRDAGYAVTTTAEVYDPSTGVSTALPPMSTPRVCAAGAVMEDGRLAVIGGWNGVSLASCEALDLRTLRWEPLPDLQQARYGHAAWAVGGTIVTAGGGTDSVEALDGDRWRTVVSARLPGLLEGAGFTTTGHGAAV